MLLLVVDDDREDRALFCEAASGIDPSIKFLVAEDGQDAVDLLSQSAVLPDYIFLDINMPKMNGKEFLLYAKKNPKLRSIPVVMYSTSSQAREIEECYKLGAFDFLIKPPSFQKLVEDLRSIFVGAERSNSRRR